MDAATIAAGAAEWDTVGALIKARGTHDAERLAVEVDGRPLTYGELDRLSDRVAASLAARGVAKGDRVASFAFNCVEQLLVLRHRQARRRLGARSTFRSAARTSPTASTTRRRKCWWRTRRRGQSSTEVAQYVTVDLRHFVIGEAMTEGSFSKAAGRRAAAGNRSR